MTETLTPPAASAPRSRRRLRWGRWLVALVVLGWFSYRDLGLDLMPRTDNPTVNVRTSLPGASAEEKADLFWRSATRFYRLPGLG